MQLEEFVVDLQSVQACQEEHVLCVEGAGQPLAIISHSLPLVVLQLL